MYRFSSAALVLLSALQSAKATQLFTVNCNPLSQQRADPVVFPGIVSPHVHATTGGTAWGQTESNAQAIASKDTTCDKIMDHSNYWQPQMYHFDTTTGNFDLVTFEGNAAYYMQVACDYEEGLTVCDPTKFSKAPPAGLRMISGNLTKRSYDDSDITQRAISHMCLQADTSFKTDGLPSAPCLRIRSQVTFPPCWDGVNLDAPDHKSHMAFPAIGDYNGGVCPQSHPVSTYQVFLEFYYNTSPYVGGHLLYAMGDATGYGLHADYVQGWTDQQALENAMPTCTGALGDNDPNCSLMVNGILGARVTRDTETPAPEENIGKTGPIAALPGNNPVTGNYAARKRSRIYGRQSI